MNQFHIHHSLLHLPLVDLEVETDNAILPLEGDVEKIPKEEESSSSEEKELSISEIAQEQTLFSVAQNCICSLIGSSVLVVPYATMQIGLVPSIIMLALLAYVSGKLSTIVILLTKEKKAVSFDHLIELTLGKCFSKIITLLFLLSFMLVLCVYIIVGYDSISDFLGHFKTFKDTFPDQGVYFAKIAVILIHALLIPVPFTFPKSLNCLTWLNKCNILVIALFVFSMICLFCGKGKINTEFQLLNWENKTANVSSEYLSLRLFDSYSKYTGLFLLTPVVIPLMGPNSPIEKKPKKVMIVVFSVVLAVALIVGIFGYMTYGEDCKDNILISFGDKTDFLTIACRFGFLEVVDVSFLALSRSTLNSWSRLFFNVNEQHQLPLSKRWVILLVNSAIPIIVAIFLPSIGSLLTFSGAIGGSFIGFACPALMFLKGSDLKFASFEKIFCFIVAFIGIISAVLSLISGGQSIVYDINKQLENSSSPS